GVDLRAIITPRSMTTPGRLNLDQLRRIWSHRRGLTHETVNRLFSVHSSVPSRTPRVCAPQCGDACKTWRRGPLPAEARSGDAINSAEPGPAEAHPLGDALPR